MTALDINNASHYALRIRHRARTQGALRKVLRLCFNVDIFIAWRLARAAIHENEQTEQICNEMQRISGKITMEKATVIQHVGSKWRALFVEQKEKPNKYIFEARNTNGT